MAPFWRWSACVGIMMLSSGFAASEKRKSGEERSPELERFVEKVMDGLPADELVDELVDVIQRTIESERRQRRRRERERDLDDTDEEALLERLGRLMVQWINTRLTPRTDEECRWNWGRWRCDPQCDCHYHYRFGDYAPGRSCRLRPQEERQAIKETCDPNAGNEVSLLEKLGSFLGKKARQTWRFTCEHVIPKTDPECTFALARSIEDGGVVCTPESKCEFRYKFGDPHLGRSCRLRENSLGGARRPSSKRRPASKGVRDDGGEDDGPASGPSGGIRDSWEEF